MIGKLLFLVLGAGVVTDANAVYTKWSQRTSAAQADYVAGVESTTKDPTALAIANQARLRANVLAAIDGGKWANNLRAVGKTGWQQAVSLKQSAFGQGVQNAQQAFVSAFGPLLQFENSLQQQVDSMPNVTDTDRENRMLAWVRGMRQYSGR